MTSANWIVWNRTVGSQYLEPFNFDLCWIELFERELFGHLTVSKQMTYV